MRAVDGCGLPHFDRRGVYLVSTADDLEWISDHSACWDDDFRMTSNIDLSAISAWDPIGNSLSEEYFTGSFDGDGYRISGLRIRCPMSDYKVGLFAGLSGGAHVHDFEIRDADSSGCLDVDYSGILAGSIIGSSGSVVVSNINVSGTIVMNVLESPGEYVGGLAGYAEEATIVDSSADVDITTQDPDFPGDLNAWATTGGLVGTSRFSDVSDSTSTGEIVGGRNLGGLVGEFTGGTIESSMSSVNLSGRILIGGLVGLGNRGTIRASSASGSVSGSELVGGMVGELASPLTPSWVHNSFSTGLVTGGGRIGGLIGEANGWSISNSYSESDVVVPDDDVDHEFAGGLVGLAWLAPITRSFAVGDVIGNLTVGGLVGYVESTDAYVAISDSYATGNVSSQVNDLAPDYFSPDVGSGGLVGATSGHTIIQRSFALGDVSAPFFAGGLISLLGSDSEVSDSFARGDVSSERAAGLIERVYHDSTIRRSYAAGLPVGTDTSAALIVEIPGPAEIVSSFWDSELSAPATDLFGAGRTTAEMLDERTYTDESLDDPWDFRSVWCIKSSLNDGYPVLRSIDFGPEDTNNCRSHFRHGNQTATFDPNGGTCTFSGSAHDAAWQQVFRTSLALPTEAECTRSGFVLLGWSRSGTVDDEGTLLHDSITRSASLTAVWGAVPAPPFAVLTLANFLCGPCRSVLLVWPISSDASVTVTKVEVDGVEAMCAARATIMGLDLCLITNLTSGARHDFSVSYRNQNGYGPSAKASVTLI